MAARAKLQLRTKVEKAREVPPKPPATEEVAGEGSGGAAALRPDRLGKKLIAGHFPKSTWATLRDLGTRLDKKNQDLLQEALDDLFAKYRQRGH